MDLGRRLNGGEVYDDDVVDVSWHEGHQESHCDQVDGKHLPGCLLDLCIDIETLRLGLRLLLINAWNSVKHVGIRRLWLHLDIRFSRFKIVKYVFKDWRRHKI